MYICRNLLHSSTIFIVMPSILWKLFAFWSLIISFCEIRCTISFHIDIYVLSLMWTEVWVAIFVLYSIPPPNQYTPKFLYHQKLLSFHHFPSIS